MIREGTATEITFLRGKSKKEYDKLLPPDAAEEILVWVDDHGIPRVAIAAQRVAEIYMVLDHDWETPAMRWNMIEQIQVEMIHRLKAKGFTVGYSFFPEGVPDGYIRRLVKMGWERVVDRCTRFAGGS